MADNDIIAPQTVVARAHHLAGLCRCHRRALCRRDVDTRMEIIRTVHRVIPETVPRSDRPRHRQQKLLRQRIIVHGSAVRHLTFFDTGPKAALPVQRLRSFQLPNQPLRAHTQILHHAVRKPRKCIIRGKLYARCHHLAILSPHVLQKRRAGASRKKHKRHQQRAQQDLHEQDMLFARVYLRHRERLRLHLCCGVELFHRRCSRVPLPLRHVLPVSRSRRKCSRNRLGQLKPLGPFPLRPLCPARLSVPSRFWCANFLRRVLIQPHPFLLPPAVLFPHQRHAPFYPGFSERSFL